MTDVKNDWPTELSTYTDERGGRRTALVVRPSGDGGSVDVVDGNGKRLVEINLFVYEDGHVIVDVIDVDRQFTDRKALLFGYQDGKRDVHPFTGLVSVDLR